MSAQLSHRLSANDSVFLYWERPEQPFHVCEIMVYDGDVTLQEIKRMLEERMHLLPRYRQRIVFAPLQLGHPTWHDDPEFDLDNHLAEATLPGARRRPDALVVLRQDLRRAARPRASAVAPDAHPRPRERPPGHVLAAPPRDGRRRLQRAADRGPAQRRTGSSAAEPPDVEWQPAPLPSWATLLRDAVADSANSAVDLARGTANSLRPRTSAPLLHVVGPSLVCSPIRRRCNRHRRRRSTSRSARLGTSRGWSFPSMRPIGSARGIAGRRSTTWCSRS